MSWRYQPVWINQWSKFKDDDEKLYILIEIFFDDYGKMDGWTEYTSCTHYEPMGNKQEE